jgi:hypothetical protein
MKGIGARVLIGLLAACALWGMSYEPAAAQGTHRTERVKGGDVKNVTFSAPGTAEWCWRMTAVAETDWEHIDKTQRPSYPPWVPKDFSTETGYWISTGVTEDSPERHFQVAFSGLMLPQKPQGGRGGAPAFVIEARTDSEYFVLPSYSIGCVGQEVALRAVNEEGEPVMSNWQVAGPQEFSGANTETITFTPTEPGEYLVKGTRVDSPNLSDIARVTVLKMDLDIDANDDGIIDDTDEPLELNTITDTPSGPYVNLNNDNDNLNFDAAGDPIEDKDEDGPIVDENDLRHIPLTFEPNISSGYVILKRANTKVRIWSDPLKGATKKVLYDNDTKTWNLGDTTQRTEFNAVKETLYAEGRTLGQCVVSAHYLSSPGGPQICMKEIMITVCPGPPKEYPNWGTMSLIMAGGQLHNQWKHFSESTPPDKYRVYVDTSDASTNPFSSGLPSGLTLTEISSTGTYSAWDKGYIAKNSKKHGGFLIHFPSRSDEGKKYWVLVRAHDSTTGIESQNKTGYRVEVDYPDLGGGRSDLSALNFYMAECDDADDIFLIEGASGECSVCKRIGAPGAASMWRVARSPRREDGTDGSYYADDTISLTGLKTACEGTTGIFAINKNKFGDWSDHDSNSNFFALVTGMFGRFAGYWHPKDVYSPWSYPTQRVLNKSNYSDVLYLNKNLTLAEMKTTFAHELQHNIHGLADSDEETWVNEGCSMYAEEINGLGSFSISQFGAIPSGETAPRAAKASLTRFTMGDVWNRFGICPRCERDSTGASNSEGRQIWSSHYQKAAIWTHYLDVNVPHQTGKTIKSMVSDAANGVAGVNNLSSTPLLQNPDGPFVKWTVANYANQVNSDPADTDYNYTGGWAAVGVTPYNGSANGIYIDRVVRNLAADYVKYTHTVEVGSLVVYLKNVGEWNMVVVNAVRLTATGDFKDVQQIAGQTVSADVRKFVVPDDFGTDFKSAVIVITNIKDTSTDSYKEEFKIKAQIE